MTESSKHYKKTMNKFIQKHRRQNEKKLRNLQSRNPKEYWKYINSLKQKKSSNTPTLNEFYDSIKFECW